MMEMSVLQMSPQISIQLINLGETSVSIRQVLTNTLDGREIATFYCKLVYVDKLAKSSQVTHYTFTSVTIIIIMNSIYLALFHSGTECSKRFTIQILPPTDLVSI